MPELPEIAIFARDMQKELPGRTLVEVEVVQPKCLNLPPQEFRAALAGATIQDVTAHGKWLQLQTTQGWLLLNLGMGGEILLTDRRHLPDKYRLIFDLLDGAALAVNFWWFGFAHFAAHPREHPMVGKLGPHALALSLDEFRALLAGRRGAIKTFLMDQERIAGIGNVYVQDPLFKAGIHPLRAIPTLTDAEVAALWAALHETLQESIAEGGAPFELNLYGQKGGWNARFLVGYREGQACPVCGTTIEKIKTGSTSSYICPRCQPLEGSAA
ncbi:MAG TPA: DNA-formamidopyrimidine glycosylase family protein [Anaerolineae bacterium]|nr:DNA-formamidopyrimidine glycosylase family protein [Anaerolineae bacterium]